MEMNLSPLDGYFENKEEPMKSFLLALKEVVLRFDPDMNISWKWRTPFFSLGKSMICYLSIQKKTNKPYLGFGFRMEVKHPALLSENRKMIKVLYFDQQKDIDVNLLYEVLAEVTEIARYKRK